MKSESLADKSPSDLRALHAELEKRLQELQKVRSQSQEEAYEVQVIKKRKLAIKDLLNKMEN